MIHIYCLINPITNTPFYVGATAKELKIRLWGHYGEVNATHSSNSLHSKRALIFNAARIAGLKIEIKHLDTVHISQANEMEAYYYNKFVTEGHFLIQSTARFIYTTKYFKNTSK